MNLVYVCIIFNLSLSSRIKFGQKTSKLSKKLSNHICVIEGCSGTWSLYDKMDPYLKKVNFVNFLCKNTVKEKEWVPGQAAAGASVDEDVCNLGWL